MSDDTRLENVLAVVLAVSALAIITYNSLAKGRYYYILWYTNFASLLLTLGIFIDDDGLCSAVTYTTIMGEFLWIADMLLRPFNLNFGRSTGIFAYPWPLVIASFLMHGLLILLGMYRILRKGYARNAISYCFVLFVGFLMPASYFFAPPEANINCVQYPCDLTYHNALQSGKYLDLSYFAYYGAYWSVASVVMHYIFLYIFRWSDRLEVI